MPVWYNTTNQCLECCYSTFQYVPVYENNKKSKCMLISKYIYLYWVTQFYAGDTLCFVWYDSLGCTSVLSLKSVKQRVLKISSGQYISMFSLTLDLWPFWPQLNRVHLLFRIYHCTTLVSLKSVKQRVLRISSTQYLPTYSLTLDLMTFWPENQ
jgi:hypothetical protein